MKDHICDKMEIFFAKLYNSKIKDTQIGYIILLIYNILEFPILQTIINIVFTIWLSVCAASDHKSFGFWVMCFVYVIMAVIFTLINNYRRSRRNIEKHLLLVSKNLKKLQYKRIKELAKVLRSRDVDKSFDTDLASEGDYVCEAIFEVLSDCLNYDDLEIVLFTQYEDEEDGMCLTPLSFGAKDNEPPACITTNFFIDCEKPYKIVEAFSGGKNIVYLTGEEVKSNFSYTDENAREKEKIKQYLAIPIRKRDGIATSVLQICIYKEGVIPLKGDIDRFISEYINPFSTFFELCMEEQMILERKDYEKNS